MADATKPSDPSADASPAPASATASPTADIRALNATLQRLLGVAQRNSAPNLSGEIPCFDGTYDAKITVTEFLNQFQLVARSHEWDDKTRALYLPLYLKGKAAELYEILPHETQKNYTKLLKTLQEHFTNDHRAQCAAIRLQHIQKNREETIEQFASRIRQLGKLAYPNLDAAVRSRQLTSCFVLGLPKKLRDTLWDKDPTSLENAEEMAIRISYRLELSASIDLLRGYQSNDRMRDRRHFRDDFLPREKFENDPYLQELRNTRPPRRQHWSPSYKQMRDGNGKSRDFGNSRWEPPLRQNFYPPAEGRGRNGLDARRVGPQFANSSRDYRSREREFRNEYSRNPVETQRNLPERYVSDQSRGSESNNRNFRSTPNTERQRAWEPRVTSFTREGRPQCFECGKPGHVARNCLQKTRDSRYQINLVHAEEDWEMPQEPRSILRASPTTRRRQRRKSDPYPQQYGDRSEEFDNDAFRSNSTSVPEASNLTNYDRNTSENSLSDALSQQLLVACVDTLSPAHSIMDSSEPTDPEDPEIADIFENYSDSQVAQTATTPPGSPIPTRFFSPPQSPAESIFEEENWEEAESWPEAEPEVCLMHQPAQNWPLTEDQETEKYSENEEKWQELQGGTGEQDQNGAVSHTTDNRIIYSEQPTQTKTFQEAQINTLSQDTEPMEIDESESLTEPTKKKAGRISLFPFTLTTILTLFIFMNMQNVCSAKDSRYPLPMLCPDSHARSLFELEPPPKCKPIKNTVHTPIPFSLQLFKQNLILYKSRAYHCIITRRVASTLTYFFNDEHLLKENKYSLEVSQAECLRMQRTKTCRFGVLKPQADGVYATQNRNPPKYTWCCKWFTFQQTNCHLIPAVVYRRHDVAEAESNCGDMSHCSYTRGDCRLRDKSRLIWTPDERANCKFQPFQTAEGTYWNHHWLSEKLQLLLTFHNPKYFTDCNNTVLIKSDQGVYAINFSEPTRNSTSEKTDSTMRKSQKRGKRQASEYQAGMRQYDTEALANYTKNAFAIAAMNLCKYTETMFWTMQALIASNPTMAMRHYMQTHYLKARGVSHLIEVVECIPITNYTILSTRSCEKGVEIHYQYNNFYYKHLMDPSTNILLTNQIKTTSRTCYRGSYEVCINNTCYHVAKTHSRVRNSKPPVKISPFAALAVNTSLPPIHTIYHDLAVYNLSEVMKRPSFNDIFKHVGLTVSSIRSNTESWEKPDGQSAGYNDHYSVTNLIYRYFPKLIIWQIVVATLFTLDAALRLSKFLYRKGQYYMCGRRTVAAILGATNQLISRTTDSQPQPSAPPPPEYNTRQNIPYEPPPGYSFNMDDQDTGMSSTPSFERWPLDLSNTVAASSSNKKSVIDLLIDNYSTTGLLDTGSAITLISEKWAKTHKLQTKRTSICARSVNNQTLPITGTTDVTITVADKAVVHTVYILRNSPFAAILGVDILKKLGRISLDFAEGNVEFNGRTTQLGSEDTSATCAVKLISSITLPPHSETRLMAKLAEQQQSPVLIEPAESTEVRSPLLVARIIATPYENTIPLRIINASAQPRRLASNTIVAYAEAFEELPRVPYNPKPLPHHQAIDFIDKFTWPTNLTHEQSEQLRNLILDFHDVFSKHDYDLGCLETEPYRIQLKGEMPRAAKPYRIPQAQQAILDEQIKKLLEAGIIEPSTSPFAAPICLVRKKNSSALRMVVDFRALNRVTKVLSYPLPNITETIDKLTEARFFSTLDLSQGFYQLKLHPEDREKTAFVTPKGLYQFTRLPMGLAQSPGCFQRAMAQVLFNIQYEKCLIYLDDIIAHSTSFEDHLKTLEAIFTRLRIHNLKLRPNKCNFAKERVKFLGHVVSKDGLSPDPDNVEKVQNHPIPKTVKQVRAFLGLSGYYRKFIQNYSRIATPMLKLLQKNVRFSWGDDQQRAFETLKKALISPPILQFPNFNKTFILQCDASDFGLGCVLSQETDGKERPVAYASRTLNSAERNYSATEKECLAIVYALKHFRPYVYGRQFIVKTDHKSLEYVLKHKDPSSKLIRWALLLGEHDMKIQYRPGRANGNADGLSRIPTESTTVCAITRQQQTPELTKEQAELKNAQQKHPLYAAISAKLKGQPLPNSLSKEHRTYIRANWEHFRLRKDILYYLDQMKQYLLVLPEAHAKKMFLEVHAGAFGGHLGPEKTLSRIQSKYFWPKMANDVKTWAQECIACEQRKRPHATTRVPLQSIPVAATPWHTAAMDIVGPLPTTPRLNKYILVITDYLTKWPEAIALPDQSATTVAGAYVNHVICRHGSPEALITDRGANFTSKLMIEICKLCQTQKKTTTPYHPQADGCCERLNQTLLQTLSFLVSESQRDWDLHIDLALLAYRTAKHSSTKMSPARMLYGRELRLPVDHFFPHADNPEMPDNSTFEFTENMQKYWQLARDNIERAQRTQKQQYDKRCTASPDQFAIGDKVYCKTPRPRIGLTKKLQKPFQGPMRIVDVNQTNARVSWADSPRSKTKLVHLNRLKKAFDQEPLNSPRITVARRHGSGYESTSADESPEASSQAEEL